MEEERTIRRNTQSATLVDLLDRVLDKGLVVAGDIVIALADVELLTIKIRLIICSVDKAEEIGMDWWRHDAFLTSNAKDGKKKEAPKFVTSRVRGKRPISRSIANAKANNKRKKN